MSRLFLSAVLALGIAAPAWAGQPSNLEIFNDVSKQVQQYPFFSIFDAVHASIDHGVVTLSGKVTMPYKRTEIAQRVAEVHGVREVRNRIDVLPVSSFDDELRFRIARAIYGNSSFWHYAAMANPPIHIVVNRGRVTLTGVVQSNVERMLARSLATGFGSFEVKNELKTDEEMRSELERIGS